MSLLRAVASGPIPAIPAFLAGTDVRARQARELQRLLPRLGDFNRIRLCLDPGVGACSERITIAKEAYSTRKEHMAKETY